MACWFWGVSGLLVSGGILPRARSPTRPGGDLCVCTKGGKKEEIDTTGIAIATGTGTGKRTATEMLGFDCLFLSK